MKWTEDLTDKQLKMVFASGEDRKDGNGFGVELRGAAWKTARSLAAFELGWIEGDPGGELPGLYFNNANGVELLHEFDDGEPVDFECLCCGGPFDHGSRP